MLLRASLPRAVKPSQQLNSAPTSMPWARSAVSCPAPSEAPSKSTPPPTRASHRSTMPSATRPPRPFRSPPMCSRFALSTVPAGLPSTARVSTTLPRTEVSRRSAQPSTRSPVPAWMSPPTVAHRSWRALSPRRSPRPARWLPSRCRVPPIEAPYRSVGPSTRQPLISHFQPVVRPTAVRPGRVQPRISSAPSEAPSRQGTCVKRQLCRRRVPPTTASARSSRPVTRTSRSRRRARCPGSGGGGASSSLRTAAARTSPPSAYHSPRRKAAHMLRSFRLHSLGARLPDTSTPPPIKENRSIATPAAHRTTHASARDDRQPVRRGTCWTPVQL
jgi:hypothetical protein